MSIMACGRRDISDSVWEKPIPVCPDVKETGAAELATTGVLSMRSLSYARGCSVAGSAPPPASGATPADASPVDVIMVWERPLEIPIDDPDPAWLMSDASHCGVHPHAAGARGCDRDMIRAKGGSTQNRIWLRMGMACRLGLLPHRTRQRIALGQSLSN